MKTDFSFKLGVTAFALVLGGLAAAYAGPSPHWINSPAKPSTAKATVTAQAKCAACTTTPIWAMSERGPGGKGVPGPVVVGKKHECKICAGNIVSEKGKTADTMVHAKACTPLTCCK